MIKRKPLSRRKLLRGAVAGSAVALPLPILNAFLNDNGTAMAQGDALPKRFGLWWWGNGVRLKRFVPSQTGAGYALSDQLQPMAEVKDDITVVTGSKCPVDGFAHHSGQAGMLTGDSLTRNGDDSSTFRRKSIDVLISEKWAGQAPFDLINLAVHRDPRYERGTPGHVSFNGNSFNPNELDPGAAYDRLFGGDSPVQMAQVDDGTAAARARARSRTLDAVLEDSTALQGILGQTDKERIEQHLDGVRDLQNRIQQFDVEQPSMAPACPQLERPTYNEKPNAVDKIAEKSRIMSEITATAYACDLSRVITVMHHTWYGVSFPESGYSGEQHNTTHNEGGDQPNIHKTVLYVMNNLANHFKALKAMPEGAGSLLDNCAIYCTTEVSEGKSHSKDRIPIIIGGGAGGRIVRGRHLATRVSSFRVVNSLFRALDIDIPSFGVSQWKETEAFQDILI